MQTGVQDIPARSVITALFPIRIFLGLTFTYAGFDKFFSETFWSLTAPTGFSATTASAIDSSPIGFLLDVASAFPLQVAFLVAAGEVLSGLGMLLGVWTKVSAAGAFALSTVFFLGLSWSTSPYYYGSDLAYMAALTPLMFIGDVGFLSVEQYIRNQVRTDTNVTSDSENKETSMQDQIKRRTLIKTGAFAGTFGAIGIAIGIFGRSRGSSGDSNSTIASPSQVATAGSSAVPGAGTKIATVSDIKVGGSFSFKDASGNDAFLLQPSQGTFLAYSAVCSHEGCSVEAKASEFKCPCHGARFDLATGEVLQGPARTGLEKLNVTVSGSDIYLA